MARPEVEALFTLLRNAPRPQSVAEMRANLEQFAPFLNANAPEVARVDAGVDVAAGVRADVIVPEGTAPFPVLVYLHGGGWAIGSPASHAKLARQLAAGAGAVVVNVDYRLAPEHPFPVPLEDCVAAVRWTCATMARYGGNADRLAIGGDSAGANLSAAVINDLRGQVGFRAALLIYGAFDLLASRRDYERYAPAEDPVLPKQAMDMMLAAYLSGGASAQDPRVSPLKADLSHFPPTCLLVGKIDPLFGESLAFQAALTGHGRAVELHTYDDMPHAFMQLGLPESDAAVAAANAFLRARLHG